MVFIKIVYFDYGGSHSSVIAANIHIGKLSADKAPTPEEMMGLPYFDNTNQWDFGKMHYMGIDEHGNEVYLLGTANSFSGSTLRSLVSLMGVSEWFFFATTMPHVNTILRIGGWLSRAASLPALGRPLIFRGIQEAYPGLVKLVERVKIQTGKQSDLPSTSFPEGKGADFRLPIFMGKNGVFETLLVAETFIGEEDRNRARSLFGNIKQEAAGTAIFLGEDPKGKQIHLLGAKNYKVLAEVIPEISRVVGGEVISLLTIPITISGENITWYLARLAYLPVVGAGFNSLIKYWIKNRKKTIVAQGRSQVPAFDEEIIKGLAAAKPLPH